ncbi:unnamed protein product [Caenorhabditis angaria]|uniref:ATP citrate synthase n=1 Tax=Caenorhabditis angaria TaxID=860376 RepID=A0A9P1NB04_9PELO|nr:unnamed protein product [Caenorhabditis angaria]
MSAKAVSEMCGKERLYDFFKETGLVNAQFHVNAGDDFNQVAKCYEWFTKQGREGRKFIKPIQLNKRRGKMSLIEIGSPKELSDWFKKRANSHVQVGKSLGRLHTFIVEPFCARQELDEMYIAITRNKEEDTLMFYEHGGGDIGDVESKVRFLKIPIRFDVYEMRPTDEQLDTLIGVGLPNFEVVKTFVDELYRGYKTLHLTYLEINPFVFVNNQIHIFNLDVKVNKSAFFICDDDLGFGQTPRVYTGGDGSVAYLTRSVGMVNELNNIISQNSDGVYEGIVIGGNRYTGSTLVEQIARYQADDRVKMIVLLGKVGGTEEYKIVDMLNRGVITKPLVAWCIETCAGCITNNVRDYETAACKNFVLRGVGSIVPISFGELGNKIRDTYDNLGTIVPQPEVPPSVLMDYAWARELGLIRKPASFNTSIFDERGEGLIDGGVSYAEVTESELGISSNLGRFWFQKSLPAYGDKFIEICLQLTADHDRDVSGAHNTIVCGRAGKNLISSLTSGLLTIGDRFGGTLDGAARQFSNAMDNGWSPMEFVNNMRIQKKHIMGIGHRAKSIKNPDSRVEILKTFAINKLEFTQETPLLEFALEVEKIMTAKNPNLILNVDGAIGVIFVDILRHSKVFTPAEAQQIIDSGTLHVLLIFGRYLRYMEQLLG